jgi:RNA polymerase sigma-70 factor (ECF subfamily)
MEEIAYKSEQEMLSALKLGSVNAFQVIVKLHTKSLLKHAFSRLKNEQDAEDMVQDIFTHVWEKRTSIEINISLAGYLFTILKHRILRHISRIDLHHKAVEHLLYRMDEMQAGILELLAVKDIETTLSETIADLPENMRKIFILKQQDYTIREIAEVLGLAEQTIKNYNTELIRRIKVAITEKHPDINHSFLFALAYLLTKN